MRGYSVDIFSYSGPSGMLGSDGGQSGPVLGACELLHFPLGLLKDRVGPGLLFSGILGSLYFRRILFPDYSV